MRLSYSCNFDFLYWQENKSVLNHCLRCLPSLEYKTVKVVVLSYMVALKHSLIQYMDE